jgi:hypothetical protein
MVVVVVGCASSFEGQAWFEKKMKGKIGAEKKMEMESSRIKTFGRKLGMKSSFMDSNCFTLLQP